MSAVHTTDRPAVVVHSSGLPVAVVPVAAALLAIGVLAGERIDRMPAAAEVLALITLLLVVGRLGLSLRRTNG